MSDIDDMLDDVKAQAEGMAERIDELESELEDMESDRDFFSQRVADLEDELGELEEGIPQEDVDAQIKEAVAALEEEVRDLKSQIAETEE